MFLIFALTDPLLNSCFHVRFNKLTLYNVTDHLVTTIINRVTVIVPRKSAYSIYELYSVFKVVVVSKIRSLEKKVFLLFCYTRLQPYIIIVEKYPIFSTIGRYLSEIHL